MRDRCPPLLLRFALFSLLLLRAAPCPAAPEYALDEMQRFPHPENLPYLSPLADFDQDGNLDFIAGGRLFLGTAEETLPPFTPVDISQEPLRVQGVGDVDDDGHPDVLIVHGLYQDTLELRLNRDGGRLFPVIASYPLHVLESPPPNTLALACGGSTALTDLNRDGFADLVAAGYRQKEDGVDELLLVGYGPAPGPIESFRVFPAGDLSREGGRLGKLTVADFNGDDFPDAVSAIESDTFTGWVTVFLSDRAGGFLPPHSYATIEDGEPRVTAASSADVDGDGDLDLVAGHWHYPAFAVLLNRGDGTFETLPPVSTRVSLAEPGTDFTPRTLEPGDLDRDGRVDLVMADLCSVESYAGFLEPGGGRRTLLLRDLCFEHVGQLRLHDFNRDGVLDLIAGGARELRVWKGLTHSGRFIRGDANGDAAVQLSDVVATLSYLFLGLDVLACLDAADANDDGLLNITDPVRTLEFLFLGGQPLPPPSGTPAEDPTPDAMGCVYRSP